MIVDSVPDEEAAQNHLREGEVDRIAPTGKCLRKLPIDPA
jgi:hypothetical protein